VVKIADILPKLITLLSTSGNAIMATLNGTTGNDVLIGTTTNDTINGGAGDDSIDGRFGLDTMDGGAGVDTLDVTFFNTGDYELDMNTGVTNFAGETAINFENVYTGAGNDKIIGNSENNVINTGVGNDWVDGGYGVDTMDGGAGIDTLDVTFWNDAYELDMTTGLTNYAGETAVNFENVNTGAGNDSITGNNANNIIKTGAGNDVLNGYGDLANGSAQIDHLYGGSGDDVFVLGTHPAMATPQVLYVEPGDGYAAIMDWQPQSGMVFGDHIQLTGNASQYFIKQAHVLGTGAMDTEIYYRDPNTMTSDRIGVIADSTAFALTADYVNWV
jgi:Ca2+-binding RTX toxin-like protein